MEIPKAVWEPVFFAPINSLSKEAKWTPLRQVDIPRGSLEVRAWIGFALSPLEGFRLRRDGSQWSGFYAREGFGEKWPFLTSEVKPKTDWESVWKKIEKLGMLALPDASTLPDEIPVRDGVCYVIEINDGERYRTYKYGNPQCQKWPEAKKIIEIIEVLNGELMPNGKNM
jgi:hypothetical protein